MSKKNIKISANEINRFTYCPYQWYYGKVYGQKALREKYSALERNESPEEGNFKKGLSFHEKYYKTYRLKKKLEWGIVLLFILLLVWSLFAWFK